MLLQFDPLFRQLDEWANRFAIGRTSFLPMDVYRDGDHVEVVFDIPGVTPDSIDVTVDRNSLTVRAQRSRSAADGEQVLAHERPHGSFCRQLFLDEGLDLDHVEARYEHGVLTLTIPVTDAAKPRRVEISAGAEQKAIEAAAA